MNSEPCVQLVEKYRYINVEHSDWYDHVFENFREDMKAVGIDVRHMYFSGFWSQGDGACFTGALDNALIYLDHHHKDEFPMIRKLLEHHGEVYVRCQHKGRYYHENSTEFWVDADTLIGMLPQPTEFHRAIADQWQEELEMEMCRFEANVICQWQTYMRDLYRTLEAEYDHLISDEVVWETIQAMENAA